MAWTFKDSNPRVATTALVAGFKGVAAAGEIARDDLGVTAGFVTVVVRVRAWTSRSDPEWPNHHNITARTATAAEGASTQPTQLNERALLDDFAAAFPATGVVGLTAAAAGVVVLS